MSSDEVLRSIGFPGNYVGYKQLVSAMEIATENEDSILNIYHSIYEKVALSFGTNAKSVEKNIRTLLMVAWQKEFTVREYERIAGYPCTNRPSISEFLDVMSNYLRVYNSVIITGNRSESSVSVIL